MNLLQLLGGSLSDEESVDNIAKKSKSSKAQVLKLVGIVLPLLITYLTRNARKEGGAKSLANALQQHKNKDKMSAQIKDADTEDGAEAEDDEEEEEIDPRSDVDDEQADFRREFFGASENTEDFE